MNNLSGPLCSRRDVLKGGVAASAVLVTGGLAAAPVLGASRMQVSENWFRVSLAQWSLHKSLFANEMTNLDFAREARSMGFEAVEYVNAFFKDKARDEAYLKEMNTRAAGEGVQQLLIMCDGEGNLGDPDSAKRAEAVENHRKWLEAAKALGCHSIRVNAASAGTWEEQQKLAADGLRRLCELADPFGLNVIVENHGGLSSNGEWLSGVMKLADHPRVGTLPDFGNFCMDWSRAGEADAWYDRYKGTAELMPFAKAVSAKSHEFNESGDEVRTDYMKMMRIVKDAGYRGWVGVEYEGDKHAERDGCRLTKALLEKARAALA